MTDTDGLNTLRPSEIIVALDAMYAAAKRRPIYLSGPPGIGKTSFPEQVAKKRGIGSITLQATNEDPITLSGLPARAADDAEHAVFLMFKDKLPTSGAGFLNIDELPSAPPAVQVGFNGLFLNGRLGSYRLPPDWYVCATGNRQTDRAGAGRLPTPVQSRVIELACVADLKDWTGWALETDIRPEIVAFLNWRFSDPADGIPNMFMNFDPSRPGPFACPRTWEYASDILNMNLPGRIEAAELAGTVGQGPAGELVAFLGTYRSLVSPDTILLHPDSADVPAELSALHSVCGALAAKATEGNFDRVMTYLERLPPEFAVMAVDRATRRDKALQHTQAFTRFAHKYGDIVSA